MALPFVALATEKGTRLKTLLAGAGIRVATLVGGRALMWQDFDVIVCTFEKANTIVNRLMDERNLSNLGLMIVDELHMLGDAQRGKVVDAVLSKLRYAQAETRIIGMSATLDNIQDVCTWMDAFYFETDFRPVPLTESIVHGLCRYQSPLLQPEPLAAVVDSTSDPLLVLCQQAIEANGNVLVFASTRQSCEALAKRLGAVLHLPNGADMTAILGQLKACKSPLTLRQQVVTGVCHHHAGLTTDERELIELGFRSSVLRVLCATSTLSAGVNLPARLVVIHGPTDATNKRLSSTAYKQMAGRAGRYGHDSQGEAVVLVASKSELELARQLLGSSASLTKATDHQKSLERSVLDVLATHQASTRQDLYSFAARSFGFRDTRRGEIESVVNQHLQQLENKGFVTLGNCSLRATTLGIAAATAALEMEVALQVKRDLDCAQQHLTLDSELHLVYLSTPISSSVRINMEAWQQFHNRWSALSAPDRSVAVTVGLTEGMIVNASQGMLSHGRAREVATRFYAAMLLHQLIKDELSPSELAWQFHIDRGALQRLQKDASSFSGMVTVFAQHLGMDSLAMLLGQFQDRLHFGVRKDLLPLLSNPYVTPALARRLVDSKIHTQEELAAARLSTLVACLATVMPQARSSRLQGLALRMRAASKGSPVDDDSRRIPKPDVIAQPPLAVLSIDEPAQHVEAPFDLVFVGRDAELWEAFVKELLTQPVVGASVWMDEHGAVSLLCFAWSVEDSFVVEAADLPTLKPGIDNLLQSLYETSTLTLAMLDMKPIVKLFQPPSSCSCILLDVSTGVWMCDPSDKEPTSIDQLVAAFDPNTLFAANDWTQLTRTARDACYAAELAPALRKRLVDRELWTPYLQIELPSALVIAKMEHAGLGFDQQLCQRVRKALLSKLQSLEAEAYDLAGGPFSLTSPVDVSAVLFQRLGLQPPKGKRFKGKKGSYSTCKSVLEPLAKVHELPKVIMRHRTASRVLSSQLQVLWKACQATADSTITVSCSTWTATGRMSVREPNLQNLMKDIALDLESVDRVALRDLVVARAGCTLVTVDYRQIELRVLAHLSKDACLKQALVEADPFQRMASQWLGVEEATVTPMQRSQAKQICYGICYGMGVKHLSGILGVKTSVATSLLAKFHRQFPGIAAYAQAIVKQARQQGYVTTMGGRRRYLPDLASRDANLRAAAERQALNTPIQGSAADIVKAAMCRVDELLSLQRLRAKLLCQIHDELMYEVPLDQEAITVAVVRQAMCDLPQMALDVPLAVKVYIGPSWGSVKEQAS